MTRHEIYYQSGKDTILYQSTLHREFSDRAFNLFNLSVASLVAGGIIFNIRLDNLEWTTPVVALGALSLSAFVVVAVLCLATLRTGDWYDFPPLDQLADWANFAPTIPGGTYQIYIYMGDYLKEAAQHNDRVLDGKSRAIFWAIIGLALEILSTISLVVLIFGESQKNPADVALTLVA